MGEEEEEGGGGRRRGEMGVMGCSMLTWNHRLSNGSNVRFHGEGDGVVGGGWEEGQGEEGGDSFSADVRRCFEILGGLVRMPWTRCHHVWDSWKFLRMLGDSWGFLRILEDSWGFLRFLRMFENSWGCLRMFENFWGFLRMLEDSWGCLRKHEDSWGHLGILEDSWGCLGMFENFWWFLRMLEDSWGFLKIHDYAWEFLRMLGDSWGCLGIFEDIWRCLRMFVDAWGFLWILCHLLINFLQILGDCGGFLTPLMTVEGFLKILIDPTSMLQTLREMAPLPDPSPTEPIHQIPHQLLPERER